MDSKTRFLMALAHEKPDRVPFNFWMDRRLMAQYEQSIGNRHWRVTHYGADVIESFPMLAFPTGKYVEVGCASRLSEPYQISWENTSSIPMPDPKAENVLDLIKTDIEQFPDKAVIMNVITPWGVIGSMLGYEQIYTDVMDHSEGLKTLSRRICDVFKVVVERACRLGITALYIQEDVADTHGLSMSMQSTQEHCLCYAKELADIATYHRIPVLFHTDGKMTDELLESFIRIGINAVNPLQPHLNDLTAFKSHFGDKLALYGGLDNCFTISQGTPQAVREHIANLFEIVGKPDGALILSSHDIDFDVPPENIETMVAAIKACVY